MSALESWVGSAKVGEMLTYGHQTVSKYPAPEVMEVARSLADRGLVRLFLKREGPNKLAYIAQRRDPAGFELQEPKSKPPVPQRSIGARHWIRRLCAAPGCSRFLSSSNDSGLCRIHDHMPGVCNCKLCLDSRSG